MQTRCCVLLLAILVVASRVLLPAAEPAKGGSEKWEKEIRAFEEADKTKPPPKDAVLFVGSSSIRLWRTLPTDLSGVPVIQRGFGGSQISDSIAFADRIILPYRPRMVVLYAGDNDIAAGKTPERVLADFKELVGIIRARLPRTRVAFIAIKPSIARWPLIEKIRRANELVKNYTETEDDLRYIDIFTPMIGEDGKPRPELFEKDNLHVNEKGYALWTFVIRPELDYAPR